MSWAGSGTGVDRGSTAAVKRRVPYLDVLRSCAIYLVIALHCGAGFYSQPALFGTGAWWLCNICSSFVRMGVPLFFMISGCLLLSDPKTAEIGPFYRKRIGKLMAPFLVWDVIYFLEQCAVSGEGIRPGLFFQELARQGSRYHLWFVYQIIGIYLLLPFLKRLVDHCTEGELAVLLAVVLLQPTFLRFLNVVQPAVQFAPFLALMEGYVGFFLAGYLLGSCKVTPGRRRLVYAGGAVGLLGGIAGNYLLSSPEHLNMVFAEGYSVTQYLTAGACFLLARELAPKLPGRALGAAEKLSGLSFGIYLAHVLVLDVIQAVWNRLGFAPEPVPRMLGSFFAVSLLTTAGVYVLSRLPVLRRALL